MCLEIDLSGLRCPLPVLRTKKALAGLEAGGRLRVLTTDVGAREDIPAFVRMAGHVLESCAPRDGGEGDVFVIRKQ